MGANQYADVGVGVVHSGNRADVLILLRWVLIIAIAYLVLFSHPLADLPPGAAIFIALYLGSNLVVSQLLRTATKGGWLEWGVVVLDIVAVAVALSLVGGASGELFVLYFVVLFLSALADGVVLAVGAALFIGAAHIYTASGFLDAGDLIRQGYIVRIPFLFAVALFFGNLVQHARDEQREKKQAEQRAMRMELLSTVSHDLRNPLGVVASLADLLLEGDAGELTAEQANLVQRMHASTRQVLNMSNNLIDAERIDLGSFPVRLEATDLRRVVEQTLVPWRTAAEIKGIEVDAVLPATPAVAEVDSVQLSRALSNLLSNAINFTPSRGKVAVSLHATSKGGWQLAVSDTGRGIPAEILASLGKKHVADGAAGAGSGLGLFIASEIAKAHGGSVSGRSEPGEGTTITLRLAPPPAVASAGIDRRTGDLVPVG